MRSYTYRYTFIISLYIKNVKIHFKRVGSKSLAYNYFQYIYFIEAERQTQK